MQSSEQQLLQRYFMSLIGTLKYSTNYFYSVISLKNEEIVVSNNYHLIKSQVQSFW